ncbi:MAG TPA: hypothetical protein VJG32_20765 [Anaerolineae bacterium]|nr:hypothetical protein [Anaerolineae bacterium]
MSAAKQFGQMLVVTQAGFEVSLQRHVPPSLYRDFHLWALSSESPCREHYLQAMGITQLVKLTVALLGDLVEDADWPLLISYSVPLNVYLTYEAISDNVAIGLALRGASDTTYELRRDLLLAFNRAMITRLTDDAQPATQLLESLQPAARSISSFQYSLNRSQWRSYAEAYLNQRTDVTLAELEYDMWPALVANIEACAAAVQSMAGRQLGVLLRHGLIDRYGPVNRLLRAEEMTPLQLAEVGTDAILVVPTLIYYIAVLAEIIRPLDRLARALAHGLLAQALRDAALLVRLLNDLGTSLLECTAEERDALLAALATHCQAHPSAQTLGEVFAGVQGYASGLFTRLQKDIAFGEFNVGLYGLANLPSMPEVLSTFGRNLSYFSQLYAQRRAALEQTLAVISERLSDERVSLLISRFVWFHEQLYRNPYYTSAGEYAIAV